jgi:ribosomal protein L12E/L44/L45/RPP1/RPP2
VAAVVVAAGGEADEEQLALLFTNLEGKDIHELLAKGEVDLKNCSSGGGGGGAAAAPAGMSIYSILFLSKMHHFT